VLAAGAPPVGQSSSRRDQQLVRRGDEHHHHLPRQYAFSTSFLPAFIGTTAKERLHQEDLDFSIVANFREPNGKPLGWVYHQSQQVNRPFPVWTGVFFVKGGQPYLGPKSLLDEVPGAIEEGRRAILR